MPLKTMRDEQPSINLVPMIDIVFQLLIFFMVGTRFTELNDNERNMAVRIPQVSASPSTAAIPSRRIVNVFSDGIVELDGAQVSLSQLELGLRASKAQNPRAGVVIRGDSNSAYQTVANVIAVCRKAEIQDVNLAVRVAQAER
jgi:biopolymer transport protein ExbD